MTKNELLEILNGLDIPVDEFLTSKENTNIYPRIVFWDYVWEEIPSSGEAYSDIKTYQISFYSKKPCDEKLLELRKALQKHGLHPTIYHEFVVDDKVVHSFLSLEIYEQ